MAIVNMKKMHLLGLKKEQDRILSALQKTGAVEIIDVTAQETADQEVQESRFYQSISKELSEIDIKLNKLKFGIDFLKPYVKEKNPLLYGKPRVSSLELQKLLSREEEVFSNLKTISDLDQRLSHLKGEESKLHSRLEMLAPWESLDIPLEELGSTDKTVFLPVVVPKKSMEDFRKRLAEGEIPAELQTVGEGRDDAYCLIIYHRDFKEAVFNIMKDLSAGVQEFSGLKGIPRQVMEEDRKRLSDIESERTAIRRQAHALSEHRFTFEILFDYWSVERDKKGSALKMAATEKTFLLTAWVPETAVEKVKGEVFGATESVYMDFADPAEDEDIPVVLSNPKLVQPFELITELYSLPDPRGIDPNVFMAPFYFVFFGMMVSDAGYGLVISLLAGLALWKLKLAGLGKKLVQLLFLGGISTFIWGAVFGGWFGDLIKAKPLWINPLDNPMAVLALSFVLGVIQIYTGLLLSAYKNVRAGNTAAAFMDQGLWIVFLSGLIMLAFPQLGSIAKYVALTGAVGLLLTQGRSQKNIIMKFLSGLISLYGVTGYLSDVLSYSRLLALGLATGVIAVVVNTMARLVGVNIIGIILMIIIMIAGHIFNIAINVLGAYVHSSRLQYIEFFGKFYDSGGRAFDPLRVKTTFVDLEDA
jgi:V/A-type H+-transporting ATPase subunit I